MEKLDTVILIQVLQDYHGRIKMVLLLRLSHKCFLEGNDVNNGKNYVESVTVSMMRIHFATPCWLIDKYCL